MQDTGPAANHRRPVRANGRGPGQPVGVGFDPDGAEEDTWFEVLSTPPVDTSLIALIPVPRGERAG